MFTERFYATRAFLKKLQGLWQLYAVGEGVLKTASAILQKFVGLQIPGLTEASLYNGIVGVIQMIAGYAGAKLIAPRPSLFPEQRAILWALLFGLVATGMSVIGTYALTLGADLGIRTLIVMSSIIPGAIFGWTIKFKDPKHPEKEAKRDPFEFRQVVGICLFLVAMWSMLGFPIKFTIALWMWLSLFHALLAAINEVLSRLASVKLNAWINNFWVGVSTIVCSGVSLAGFWCFGGSPRTTQGFWIGSIATGAIVVAMISCKFLAYQVGGSIALKKMIMQGTYLITVVLAGVVIYHEPATIGKAVGVLLFFVALLASDKDMSRMVITFVGRLKPA